MFIAKSIRSGLIAFGAISMFAAMTPAQQTVAQQPSVATTDDEAAIRASALEYEKNYAAGNAKALANAFLSDGEIVDPSGRTIKGREAIEQEFAEIFDQQAGAKVKVKIDSIKFLSPDVAIETGTEQATSKSAPSSAAVKYTAVHVKRDGKWLLANVNESATAPSDAQARLEPLSYLVGNWKADLGEGKTYQLECQWMPGGTFLTRKFQVLEGTKSLGSGVQIIGFDPMVGQICSWTFDSSGGFGHEMWEDHGNGWRIEATSVLPDGAAGLATNYLTKGGPDSFTWQSTERSLNDQLLPDTALVRVVRESK
jgi:uncharacterized protein (TIGR02246 family)